jgi:hypothetical protein
MLIDCASNNKNLKDNQQIIWFVFILFTHIVGAVLYFLFAKN